MKSVNYEILLEVEELQCKVMEITNQLQSLNDEIAKLVRRAKKENDLIISISKDKPENKIFRLLVELGVPARLKGHRYLTCAIQKAIEDSSMLEALTKRLYPSVAKTFDTTPNRVERAIRHAIEVAFVRGKQKFIEEIFGYTISDDKGKPTNGEFIAQITAYINNL